MVNQSQYVTTPSSSDTYQPSGGSSSSSGAKTLGKDDFLKLLVGQLQNQDPMQPTDDAQWIGQMAQFTQVEQVTNMAASLNKSSMFGLIGKTASYTDTRGGTGISTVKSGTVQEVDIDQGGNATLTIGGTSGIALESVTQVK